MYPSVQFSSVTRSCSALCTQWTASCQFSLSITHSQSLLKLMSIDLVILSNHLILCRPVLLFPSIFPSIMVFSSESALCFRWSKYWSFSFNISLSNEYSGLISFRVRLVWYPCFPTDSQESSPFSTHPQSSGFYPISLSILGKTFS